MSLYAEKKRFKISVVRANRILQFAEPALVDEKCVECGGACSNSSPMTVDHSADCRGVERCKNIHREFMEAMKAWASL